jgi:hypothetical protein
MPVKIEMPAKIKMPANTRSKMPAKIKMPVKIKNACQDTIRNCTALMRSVTEGPTYEEIDAQIQKRK